MKRALLCAALGVAACGEPADRPETISVCETGGCDKGSTGAKGSDSSGSSTTGGSATTDQGVTLRGGVRVFVDDVFVGHEGWDDPAVVQAPGAEGAIVEAQAVSGDFNVDGVEERSLAWVLLHPEDTSLITPMPLLQPINTVETNSWDLFMVNRDVLEEMFAALAVQATIAEDRAQVVLQLVGTDEEPVPGVSIQTTEGDFVAYYDGTSWSDQNTATDELGLVLIGNVVAPKYPGRGIQVIVEGAEDENFAVDVAEGAVTWAPLLVE